MQLAWRHTENGRSKDFVLRGPVEKVGRSHSIVMHHLILNDLKWSAGVRSARQAGALLGCHRVSGGGPGGRRSPRGSGRGGSTTGRLVGPQVATPSRPSGRTSRPEGPRASLHARSDRAVCAITVEMRGGRHAEGELPTGAALDGISSPLGGCVKGKPSHNTSLLLRGINHGKSMSLTGSSRLLRAEEVRVMKWRGTE
jgi:hypothetical protein